MENGRSKFLYWQRRTLVGTMIGYALYYFVRKNFSIAMPGLEAEFGITKIQLGVFLTLHGLVYGLSRFLNGFIADRFSGRVLMVTGLVLCSGVNFLFGFSDLFAGWFAGGMSALAFTNTLVVTMGVLWVLNGYLQGMGCPPCNRLLTHWIPPKELATKMSFWNTSHSVGAGLVVILCGWLMTRYGAAGWRLCFIVPASISLVGAVWLWFTLRDTPASVGLPEIDATEGGQTPEAAVTAFELSKEDEKKLHRGFLRKHVFGNRIIWILAFSNFFVYIIRFAILDWGPTLLKETKGVSLFSAGWMVALFEIAGIVGMLFAGWLTDRYMRSRAQRTALICFMGAAISVFVFFRLPAASPQWVMFLVLCLAGFFIYGPQALLGISAANQATRRAAATANGLVGLFGYASTIVSGVGLGFIVQHYGWNSAVMILVMIAVTGCLILFTIWKAPADGYGKARKLEAELYAGINCSRQDRLEED